MTVPAVNRIITALDDRIKAIATANGYSTTVQSTRQASPPPPCSGAVYPLGFTYWIKTVSEQQANGFSRRVGQFAVELWDNGQSDQGMSIAPQLTSDIISAVYTTPGSAISSTQSARLGYTNGNVVHVKTISEEPVLELVPESNILTDIGAMVLFEITYHTAQYTPFFQDEP